MTIPTPASRAWPVLLIVLILLSCALVESRGTLDVLSWLEWINDYRVHGPITGYEKGHTDYPPLMTLIFYSFAEVFSHVFPDDFISVKITILLWSLGATALMLLWTRNYQLAALFHLSFILNTVCLGYADIVIGLLIVLTLYALYREKLVLFAIAFSIAIFVKWQSLVLAPFLLLYVLYHYRNPGLVFIRCVLPACIICGAVIVVFGWSRLIATLHWATHHEWLSANALNIPWILTFCYRAFLPETFGGLHQGEITYIATAEPPLVFMLSRGAAIAAYVFAWLAFLRSTKTFSKLLLGCIAGYLAYFTLNTGVHENHLFLTVILGFVLVHILPEYWRFTITLAVIFNLNQFLFYGFSGHQLLPRVVAGVDVSLLLALAASALFARWYYRIVCNELLDWHGIDGVGRVRK